MIIAARPLPSVPSARRLRVGVINLMPHAETYAPLISAAVGPDVDIAWIRLQTHDYTSSDPAHLAALYEPYERVVAAGPLDGLVLTGAPVETIEYTAVRYWDELAAVLQHARTSVRSTLGVCWGAMALAKTLGIEKQTLPSKVFGSFEHELSPTGRRFVPAVGATYRCAQSRHAGLREDDIDAAEGEGRVTRLAAAAETGTALLATPDLAVVMHLGHPEYEPSRIAYEWARDRAAQRPDVSAPHGFDPDGREPLAAWDRDSAAFFSAWRDLLADAVAPLGAPRRARRGAAGSATPTRSRAARSG